MLIAPTDAHAKLAISPDLAYSLNAASEVPRRASAPQHDCTPPAHHERITSRPLRLINYLL